MKGRPLVGAGVRRRSAPIAIASLTLAVSASAGCLDRPIAPLSPLTTSTVTDRLAQSGVDKIDLLLMVDNSRSMADKQAILAAAVPDLVQGILNPSCVDATGTPIPSQMQPMSPTAPCPTGAREFTPVLDVHVGIITSSLGTLGADGCETATTTVCPNSTALDDQGQLVTRTDPNCAVAGNVPTYQNDGFLAWDPKMQLTPPGETSITNFTTNLTDLVTGTGQTGCGFEAQNEAWYRFLVDPAPITTVGPGGAETLCLADPSGTCRSDLKNPFDLANLANNTFKTNGETDAALLAQRGEFLRPDSLLAIIVLTDETDVSIKAASYFPMLGQNGHLPQARTECQSKGPGDPCCSSTGLPTPATCQAEAYAQNANDNFNIRAFGLSNGLESLKARYGVDFLYPTSRYVEALTSATLTNAAGKTFANPLLAQRDPSLVFYATITGVPWQLIARQTAAGVPNLLTGLNPTDPTGNSPGGFKTPAELDAKDSAGNTLWADIVGNPDTYVAPLSPFMQESTLPRSGMDPITGTMILPTTTVTPVPANADAFNGHERTITGAAAGAADAASDIQYACIFPRLNAVPSDPTDPGNGLAFPNDCTDNTAALNNPLCIANPNDKDSNGNELPTFQAYAKAYPGVRNLAIVEGMHVAQAAAGVTDTGIVASICAVQVTSQNNTDGTPAADYGYRPAVRAIIDRLKAVLGKECLSRSLTPKADGTVPCLVLEASPPPAGGQCGDCSATARTPIAASSPQAAAIVAAIQTDPAVTEDCWCEITPATGAALTACQQDVTVPSGNDGWCYIDATVEPPIGNPAIVSSCPTTEQRQVRFVGAGNPVSGATVFTTCEGT
jgi:hypothetical protein